MKAVRWSLMALLAAWGMLSLLVLAGEENPVEPVALARFVAVYATAGDCFRATGRTIHSTTDMNRRTET